MHKVRRTYAEPSYGADLCRSAWLTDLTLRAHRVVGRLESKLGRTEPTAGCCACKRVFASLQLRQPRCSRAQTRLPSTARPCGTCLWCGRSRMAALWASATALRVPLVLPLRPASPYVAV